MKPCVLIIAGLDPSGGAGLTADVATVLDRGQHPLSVASALTVQDSARCHASVTVAPELVARQIALLVDDFAIGAVKVGMVGTRAMAEVVAEALAPLVAREVPVVVDPVLAASVGAALFEPGSDGSDGARRGYAALLSVAHLLTPNRGEAEALLGRVLGDEKDDAGETRAAAARALRALGPHAVLLKGGHFLDGEREVIDFFDDGGEPLLLRAPRLPGPAPHGTGCALSTEIACSLAAGSPLRQAVVDGRARFARRFVGRHVVGRGRAFLGRGA